MIDICDFAVGLSRQLYGLTMHSERPGHRMYEQWHPLGPSRHHHLVQLPGGSLVVERGHRRRVRRHHGLEAFLVDAACRGRGPAHLQPASWPTTDLAASSTWRSAPAASSAIACWTTFVCRSSASPARSASASTWPNESPHAWAARYWNSAATTPSSWSRRRSGNGDPRHRLRRRRHRGPALHDHAPHHRAQLHRRRTDTTTRAGVRNRTHRRPARSRHPDGAAGGRSRRRRDDGGPRTAHRPKAAKSYTAAKPCRSLDPISSSRPSCACRARFPWCVMRPSRPSFT